MASSENATNLHGEADNAHSSQGSVQSQMAPKTSYMGPWGGFNQHTISSFHADKPTPPPSAPTDDVANAKLLLNLRAATTQTIAPLSSPLSDMEISDGEDTYDDSAITAQAKDTTAAHVHFDDWDEVYLHEPYSSDDDSAARDGDYLPEADAPDHYRTSSGIPDVAGGDMPRRNPVREARQAVTVTLPRRSSRLEAASILRDRDDDNSRDGGHTSGRKRKVSEDGRSEAKASNKRNRRRVY
ncbi:hypothetical protein K466DRAFT_662378 [Polyporus arcularius HHB13444]|uniref:Uncharacterized protein n=1 Tax=Polyporus arcularius HHB13444 TaxID=1314778 RepID=A0A5C3PHJ5_9APHY|nr:hypothetical protein K466DRAFT_662378 [Polyporus arcularius HHB13444]